MGGSRDYKTVMVIRKDKDGNPILQNDGKPAMQRIYIKVTDYKRNLKLQKTAQEKARQRKINSKTKHYNVKAEETLSSTDASFSRELDTTDLPDGTHTVSVIVTDKAGNQSDQVQKSFFVDHTPPACHIEVYGTKGDGGSFHGQVTLKAVCTDDGSGVDETFINTGDGRVPSETVIPDGFTGSITPLVAGIDNAGNDSGDMQGDMILMPDGTPISTILVDNTPPVVTGYYEPSSKWLNIETIDLFVTGHDDEGPLYSGTIILNGKSYDIQTESDRAELTKEIPEGISSLKYYVTDLAGNRSEIIGK